MNTISIDNSFKKTIRSFKRIKGRLKHNLLPSLLSLISNAKKVKVNTFLMPQGIKEISLIGILVSGLVFIICAMNFGSSIGLILAWFFVSVFALTVLYGVGHTTELMDILIFLPFRVITALGLVLGYAFIVLGVLNEFTSSSLSVMLLTKSAALIFGYIFLAPFVYKHASKIAGSLSIKFMRFRPYFERRVRGEYASEYFLRGADRNITNSFLARKVRGIIVYPEEPLYQASLKQIKTRLGADILGVSLEDMRGMVKKKEYKKYFELISFLRPEINQPDFYEEMYPFVTLIKPESVKEFDLGVAKNLSELNEMVAGIKKEKEYKVSQAKIKEEVNLPWYDRKVEAPLINKPILLIPVLFTFAALNLFVLNINAPTSFLRSLAWIVLLDAIFVFRKTLFKQKTDLSIPELGRKR